MISRDYIAIEDLVETIIDNRGKTVPIIDGSGIPLIATNCIKFSSIYPVFENIRYISQDTYDTWFRAHLEPNDILFVNKGTPGRCCIIPDPVNFVGAQDMVGLRFKKEYHPFYMLAVIRSNEIQETIQNNHVGLVIAHFRKQELVKLKLPILNKDIRDYIGEIYKNISYKIELNNKINAELEAMAKTLYDYWFVQFDFPNEERKPYKSSGGKMVWNEELKREIPEGWEVKRLDDVIDKIIDYRGRTPKKLDSAWSENVNDIIAISAKHIKKGKLVSLNEANRVDNNLYSKWMKDELSEGDILMTSEAPCGEFFYLIGETKYCLSQRVFAIRSNTNIVNHSYLYFELSFGNGYSQIMGKVSGSTVFGIRQDELRTVNVLIPNKDLQNSFEEKLLPIYKKIRINDKQNQELASLRDWLLPMLMNGQVTVGDVEEQLGMVAEDKEEYKKS